jgi:flagellar hook protein FlgE
MAMNQAFYTGISGVKTMQFGIEVTSDNIANVNTVGFKQSRAEFTSLFHKVLTTELASPTDDTIGVGSRPGATTLDMSQGSLMNTDRTFDLAIGGNGYFGTLGVGVENVSDHFYTRAGNFGVDSEGYLVNPFGEYLLGTLGNNIAPTSLTAEQLAEYGTYINSTGTADPYAITPISSIALGEVGAQDKIILPDLLYYPSQPTENVSVKAVIDSEIIVEPVDIPINNSDYTTTLDTTTQRLNIDGTIATTQGIIQPRVGDLVAVTISDTAGLTRTVNAYLKDSTNPNATDGAAIDQANAVWNIKDYSVSAFDTTAPLTYSAKIRSEQESRTTEDFYSDLITQTGDKNDLHVELKKQVPQPNQGSIWDATATVTKFYEDYDDTKTYDPTQYIVDKNTNKVYEILSTSTGVLEFNANGALTSNTLTTVDNEGTAVTINLGTPFDPTVPNTGYDGISTRAGTSQIIDIERDGVDDGFLTQYNVGNDGDIVAGFTNGMSTPVAKIAIYHFQNEQGLLQVGGQKFQVSENSGDAIFYKDASGQNMLGATLYSMKLENSNVSLSNALTELIINQRALDANAKSITTGDELVQKALEMGA